jgi:hypothetical protein
MSDFLLGAGVPVIVGVLVLAYNLFIVKAVPKEVKPYLQAIVGAIEVVQISFPNYFNDPAVLYDDVIKMVLDKALYGKEVTEEEKLKLESFVRVNLLKYMK